MIEISISKTFTEIPGGRYRRDGKYSGEQFRDEVLEPAYIKAKNTNERIFIDLDGGYGYAISFLEEAFGGLARLYPKEINTILSILDFKSEDQPGLINKIKSCIEEAVIITADTSSG